MKTITTAIASTLLIASMGASADSLRSTSDQIMTDAAPTKEAAYNKGLNKLNDLKTKTPYELEYELSVPLGSIESGSLEVTDSNYITVEERLSASGQKEFIGVVNVGLTYEEHDSDN